MNDNQKPIGKDFTGYEVITDAVKNILNRFPGLYPGETIAFENLEKESGIAFSADSGALIIDERRFVTGDVYQKCRYPFFVIYRLSSESENQKLNAQKFLDALGKWICREPALIDGEFCKLGSYPKLAPGRKITRISRDNFYGLEPYDSGVQDWLLPVTIEYENEF